MNVTSTTFGSCINYIRSTVPTIEQAAYAALEQTAYAAFAMTHTLGVTAILMGVSELENGLEGNTLLMRSIKVATAATATGITCLGYLPLGIINQEPRIQEAVSTGIVGGVLLVMGRLAAKEVRAIMIRRAP